MNNTKWLELWKHFYYGIECSEDKDLCRMQVLWEIKYLDGSVYGDATWTHFDLQGKPRDIDWLKIELTPQNRDIVLDILRKVHVPGEVLEDCVYVYGYRTDVDYIT